MLLGWPLAPRSGAALLSRSTWLSLANPVANHEWQD